MVLNFMLGAAYNEERWGAFFRIQKQNPKDKYLVLSAKQLVFCLRKSLGEDVTIELVEMILESGRKNGTFDAKKVEGITFYKFNKPNQPRGLI